ncbi:tryptophan synthase subunit alpha [Streptomyces sp. WI04-05B]|uniref:tryptophan synthase subunit alpha n=1 Tax=Streptomyces TaxID=1883 RepID=UPI0029A3A817|nr:MULTISPECIES: tryptophan synthase subunit alpha [unclassified Streptomyces]MDX2545860.1 tryptophan synthase subunit alpha [Streptomyces sp. WI04-05B]MDX2586419.1 tryptophan synthase subunit alpha [Streptomyces sp. WI04-05A]
MTRTAPDRLAAALSHPQPALGAFSVAGYPDLRSSVDAFAAFAESGAAMLEVGVPVADPWLDGPAIAAAHGCALRAGDGIGVTLETVRRVSARCDTPVVVMSYWTTIQSLGPQRMADELAAGGAAGCFVPDVPPERVEAWVAAAAEAGISAPLLANRDASYVELGDICRAASGFVYVPAAAGQLTGYSAGIDLDGLAAFVQAVQQFAPSTPILTGIGVSTPELASAIVGRVDVSGVVIGSPLVRSLRSGAESFHQTAALVEEFVAALAVGGAA